MSTIQPCINPNPDIAGIGVRVSVYIQALLNLVCAIIFARDGWISSSENTILTTTATNLFVTGCALIVCAFVQAATFGFSVYHALIVLNLSWIISLSALLYVIITILNWFLELANAPGCGGPASDDELSEPSHATSTHVVLLSVFHLSAMGAFGIWLWVKLSTFGDQPDCTPKTFLTIFGHDIPVIQSSLRRVSIGLYSMAVVPFLNLFIIILAGALVTGIVSLAYCGLLAAGLPHGNWHRFALIWGTVAVVLLEVLFIVDTELLISRTTGLKWVKTEELQWSFGQTLALILVVVPLFETMKAGFKSWKEGSTARADYRARKW